MSDHAPLSPSAAHRWMNCPGSVALAAERPNVDSVFAAEGTMLHEIIAQLVMDRVRPDDFKEIRRPGWTDDQVAEYTELMQECLRVFWRYYDPDQDTVLVEQRLYFRGDIDVWGTGDIVLIGGKRILVLDWKFGRGVEVDAIENEQLLIYMLAAYFEFDFIGSFDELIGVICQPRIGPSKEWRICGKEAIQERHGVVLRGAAQTRQSTRLAQGDWCRFCPALSVCPEVSETALAQARTDFDVLDVVARSSPEHIANAMEILPRLQRWIKAVEAEAMIRLNDGREVPGYKLVEGRRGHRKPVDQDRWVLWINSEIGMQGYETKVRSVAQIEKLAKKMGTKVPADMYDQAQGKLHVAPISDPRTAVSGVQLDFDVLDDENDSL